MRIFVCCRLYQENPNDLVAIIPSKYNQGPYPTIQRIWDDMENNRITKDEFAKQMYFVYKIRPPLSPTYNTIYNHLIVRGIHKDDDVLIEDDYRPNGPIFNNGIRGNDPINFSTDPNYSFGLLFVNGGKMV